MSEAKCRECGEACAHCNEETTISEYCEEIERDRARLRRWIAVFWDAALHMSDLNKTIAVLAPIALSGDEVNDPEFTEKSLAVLLARAPQSRSGCRPDLSGDPGSSPASEKDGIK